MATAEAAEWKSAQVAYEDIVLAAWKHFPESFSLRNHPEHPDASDVHKRIYQNLKPAGYVTPIGSKVFRITEEGLLAARTALDAMDGRRSAAADNSSRLTRAEQGLVEHAISSPAFLAWRAGRRTDLIDYDARIFFQFTAGTAVSQRAARVKAMFSAIEHAMRLGVGDADEAFALATALATQFARLWKEEKPA